MHDSPKALTQSLYDHETLTVIVHVAYEAFECLFVVVIIHCKIVGRLMLPLAIDSEIHFDLQPVGSSIHLQRNLNHKLTFPFSLSLTLLF